MDELLRDLVLIFLAAGAVLTLFQRLRLPVIVGLLITGIFLVVVCLGTAWATTAVGLPVSLGAFLAGLAIAGTQYSGQTLAEVVPFHDLLVNLFFISIGMMLDVTGIWQNAAPAVLVIAGVLVVKFLSGLLPALRNPQPSGSNPLVSRVVPGAGSRLAIADFGLGG